MANIGQHVDLDEKPTDVEHQEVMARTDYEYELKKSRFDDLSIPRTLWVFRKTALVVLSLYTGQSIFPPPLAAHVLISRVPLRRLRSK
jgi:hypothetical protein